MSTTIHDLEMTSEEFAFSENAIKRSAYFKWIAAGRPAHRSLEFWLEAEREWIEGYYPPRVLANLPCTIHDGSKTTLSPSA
jgi:hypothetical protein